MIFKPAARYPADPRAVFILALSVFAGLTALALQVAPQSLEALLPAWGVVTWGATLTMGSAITLAGMSRQTVNGVIVEQVGSAMVGAATIFYSLLILAVLGPDALQSVGIVLSWGLACFVRWIQLQVLIHNAVKRKAKIDFLNALEVEIENRRSRGQL